MTLPSGWVDAPLGEIAVLENNLRIPVNAVERAKRPGTTPYLGANSQAGTIDGHTHEGDRALLAEDGGYFDQPHRGVSYLATGKFWVNNHAHVLRPHGGMTAEFLVHWLNAMDWMPHVGGTTRLKLNAGSLRIAPFKLPPLPEQRRIVARLNELLARSRQAKESLSKLQPLLDKLRQSVLASAFRGDLTKAWREANPDVEPAEKLLERIRAERRRRWEDGLRAKGKDPKKATYVEPEPVDTEGLPELPSGWAWASVAQLSDLQLGQQRAPIHAAADVTYPYVRAANIKWDGLDLSDVKRMGFPNPERYTLRSGDVLLTEASGSPSEVGKPVIWRGEIETCCYQKTVLRARPLTEEVASEWLHLAFLADARLGRFARMAPGVGILHLTAERMLPWPIPVAPVAEQRALIAMVPELLRGISSLERKVSTQLTRLATLDQSLLAKAFRGELVPQDPSDEPASELLERIRAERADSEGGPKRGRKAKSPALAAKRGR